MDVSATESGPPGARPDHDTPPSTVSRLRAILDATGDAIVFVDTEGSLVEHNDRFLRLWNLDPDRARGLRFADWVRLVEPLLADAGASVLLLEPTGAAAAGSPVRLRTRDGRVLEATSTEAVREDVPIGRIWRFRDVTERSRLEEVRNRMAAVVEGSDDAIVSKTLQGIITTWNAGAERLFGYRADEVVGKSITMLIPEDRRSEEIEILRRLAAGERIEHFETLRIHKDGRPIPVSLTISPIRDSSGEIVGASKIARDTSARVESERTLEERTRILDLLNRTGKSIARDLDLETIVQTVTDTARRLSGAEFASFFHDGQDARAEAYELSPRTGAPQAFEVLGLPRSTPLLAPTFRGEGPIRIADVLVDPRYGRADPDDEMPRSRRPLRSYMAVPVVSRGGEVLGGLFFGHSKPGVFTQRSEDLVVGVASQAGIAIDNARLYERLRKAADERLELLEAERAARMEAEHSSLMKDEFLATLSHELRTPLNAIVGWTQILQTYHQDDPRTGEGLAVIDRNARVQTQLIEDLLDMNRIVSGKLRVEVQRVDLQEVVRAAIESVHHSAEAKGVRLTYVLDERSGPILGDPARLQQCCWNLLSNAIKFTSRGGKVHVSLRRVSSHVELAVVDTGQGISEEFLPYVFERFRQADASTTRMHRGLGLGLSIVKSLVELHGGTVQARSAGVGHGSTFRIELPLMAIDEEDGKRRAGPRAEGYDQLSLRGLTVLMVDDEADARLLVKRLLEDCGAKVVVAESAREGLESVRREHPNMLISDIGMPEEDGYAFIRKVRSLRPEEGGDTPAAALSAFARTQDRTRALRAGYQMYIAKPVDPSELTAAVASLARK